MCLCMYVCLYVCMLARCVCVYIYIYICICMYVCMYVSSYVCMFIPFVGIWAQFSDRLIVGSKTAHAHIHKSYIFIPGLCWNTHIHTHTQTDTLHIQVLTLGLKFADWLIVGSNNRTVAMLQAFKSWARDFTPPADKGMCVCVCMYVCMYACMFVCVCMYRDAAGVQELGTRFHTSCWQRYVCACVCVLLCLSHTKTHDVLNHFFHACPNAFGMPYNDTYEVHRNCHSLTHMYACRYP
jgi:hypothetical protein